MKGDRGICNAGEIPNQIRRTKFDTEKNCIAAYNSLLSIGGVVPTDFVIYKCKVCNNWHFGKPEWKKLFEE